MKRVRCPSSYGAMMVSSESSTGSGAGRGEFSTSTSPAFTAGRTGRVKAIRLMTPPFFGVEGLETEGGRRVRFDRLYRPGALRRMWRKPRFATPRCTSFGYSWDSRRRKRVQWARCQMPSTAPLTTKMNKRSDMGSSHEVVLEKLYRHFIKKQDYRGVQVQFQIR